jgi:hypothetical protein
MMKSTYVLLAFTMAVCACHGPNGPYNDKDKWMMNSVNFERMFLRGGPRQVTEYSYPAGDTSRSEKRHTYARYGFDAEGNITSICDYRNDSPFFKIDQWLDAGGMQGRLADIVGGRVDHTVSRRLRDGRYEIIQSDSGVSRSVTIISFLDGGDESVMEFYRDSADLKKPSEVTRRYYEGNRLIRMTSEYTQGLPEARLYYSVFDSPDSAHFYLDTPEVKPKVKTLSWRQVFFHNAHGDVVMDMRIEGMDTVSLIDFRYVYDGKGNWVRQVAIPRIFSRERFVSGDTTVTDRVFVY